LRAELLNSEQLERHATAIAEWHTLAAGTGRDTLLARLAENERVLVETHDLVSAAADQARSIEPAAEWLLDNFYLVEEQVRAIRRLLPPAYCRVLPHLASIAPASVPRVYDIGLELIAHADGRIEMGSLDGFIASYQSVAPLTLGELWALPLMLRLALIENLRRVALRIAAAREQRDMASDWADRMVKVVEQRPTDLVLVLADMARANPPLSGAFVAEFTRHLQGQNPNFALASGWLEHRLTDQGLTIEQLVRSEGQAQAADQVSIGNSIGSLRFLIAHDWRKFVSQHSVVEKTLAGDPSGVYATMDFATRDRYRHAVEAIARRARVAEDAVALKAIGLAEACRREHPEGRRAHVGYFLVDRGRSALERAVRMRLTPGVLVDKLRRRWPLACFLSVVGSVTIASTLLAVLWMTRNTPDWVTLLMAVPVVLCASQFGVGIANWLVARLVSPQSLPRLDFEHGIPPGHRTMVAVPTMLTTAAGVEHLLENLEVRYLANRDRFLHFALVTDFTDALSETLPGDAELVRVARDGIMRLNDKYASERRDAFYLFHRPRRWNARDGVWMGYERKRGKLADLNATLRGATDRFSEVVGEWPLPDRVRYVLTLDSDTELPRDAARQLVGTLAHPLNQPVFDEVRCRVVDGYTILQPRVAVSLPTAGRSRFVQVYGSDPGVDPYTRVVSDVYQDLSGDGSFIGKAIYDIDAFDHRCSDFPENAILSHDLIEGAYGRSGLVSDVTLYEDYPSRYSVDVARRHRWMRGDWQIVPWLFPWVRGRSGRWVRNPISPLSTWKIFDNLRRSLVPIAMLLVLLVSWMTSPSVAGAALVFLGSVTLFPLLLATATELLHRPIALPATTHWRAVLNDMGRPLAQQFLAFVFLPYEACVALDAIVRTLVRVCWTKRRMLEWKTACDSDRGINGSLRDTFVRMQIAPIIATVAAAAIFLWRPDTLPFAMPFIAAWMASPFVAWWLSRPIPKRVVRLTQGQHRFLEGLARKSWRYFEDFVTAEDNWLPPDNVQINPNLVVASRTSPTNIGMALLADLAAHDFGYCSGMRLLERTQRTLATLGRLERYHGHFFNWYDTRTLTPLHPRYVSTVDSGNLAANLLVLANGCEELTKARILSPRVFAGLRGTARELLDAAERSAGNGSGVSDSARRLIASQIEDLNHPALTLSAAVTLLSRRIADAEHLVTEDATDTEFTWWAAAYLRTCKDHYADLVHLAPWQCLPEAPQGIWQPASGTSGGTLADLRDGVDRLNGSATLQDVAALPETLIPLVDRAIVESVAESTTWLKHLRGAFCAASEHARARIQACEEVARLCREYADMDFSLLYNACRGLFTIGYNVDERRLDNSFYDLLASEARLASFIVIAQGQCGQEHWFALGRLLTKAGHVPALLSWSGSMFEYLMPLLVMPTYENTLLDRTYEAVVRRQIQYGRQRGIPWGISESGYNAIDQHRTYQYRAFGVPGLGLKRGLVEDLVVAPYASVLALMVAPEAACKNLERLAAEGQSGAYGFYEAIDYTPSRLPPGARSVTVRQFMAHHEGMSLLALAAVLLHKPMQRRFLADPMLRSADLLLQERVPKATAPVFPHASEASVTRPPRSDDAGNMRVFTDPNTAAVEAHLLSNGNYHVAITSAGGGSSRWRDMAVTRWREDATRDAYGSFCYVRDLGSGVTWSDTWQPTKRSTTGYEAIFTQSRAEFRRIDQDIETYTQISVSPEDDVEVRRVTLINRSESPRTVEVTSYAEVVLATQAQDEAHPAFSNLFVQTELIRGRNAIYCTRRPRSAEEQPPWMTHMMAVRGGTVREPSFETDRMRFVGRQRTLESPAAFDTRGPLSNTAGPVLDPIVSIRQAIILQPNESVAVDIITGVAASRAGVDGLTGKYADLSMTDRVFDLAWTHSHILLQQLGASEADAQIYGRLAGSILYTSALRRAKAGVLGRNQHGQSRLWGYGISGDLPIVLVRIQDHERLSLVRDALTAHSYWRQKGLAVDLVIWNEDDSVYRQDLQQAIVDLAAASPEASLIDRPGGIFVRRGEQMSDEDRTLLQTVARVVLLDHAGTLAEQVERRGGADVTIPRLEPIRRIDPSVPAVTPRRELAYFNGLGGFSQDGREYVTILAPGQTTPAPWVNVIANPQFGTIVSEGGSGYTWAENSHEYRLTPWNNDPVSDTCGEALYLRDEESGRFWSPSPLPARGGNHYVSRHGFGYSIFDYTEDGITTELCIYVATDASVKFCKLKITNRSGRPRSLSATAYWELVLGDSRSKSLPYIVTENDTASGAILARNVYSPEFGDRVAFFNCSEAARTITGDRTEFIGRNGTLARPAALQRVRLSGRVGAGYDPCAAMQAPFTLADGQERTITFTIGAGRNLADARALAQRFRGVESAERAIHAVWDYWSHTLGVVHVETPDASVNFLTNGWLVYQTLSSRMWGRSGFYQSGGAFGFRDQLQDAMALIYAQPQILRDHLVRAAGRQFREGDVQHWWHPPVGRGVRTHFSDDYLWLPLAICRYVSTTGDTGVLDERIPFLTSRLLRDDEESSYDLPHVSDDVGTLYEHGIRAIERGLRFGEHGLPLMGCGDWNDGMNLVGQHGRGESVWLAFFLYHVLMQFGDLATRKGDSALADRLAVEAGRLRGNIVDHGWDGQWYRRAYFDDGTPLGSAENEECQIDAISQSWSVLSGAGTSEHATIAMQSVEERLVRTADRLILLLDPPFDTSDLNPGYIKGYVPGVRENGGQYTHSAIWTVMARAALGNCDRAWELFSLINPVSHGATPAGIARYRVEPYVVAADVYGVEPHTGRGGWTWYTGSAGWMYRLIVESLLGLRLEVDTLFMSPCLPAGWTGFKVHYRYRGTFYHVTIRRAAEHATPRRMTLDGAEQSGTGVRLFDDHQEHHVEIEVAP
jgi:cellobiose phosphorylase